jgi:hypothetical protein
MPQKSLPRRTKTDMAGNKDKFPVDGGTSEINPVTYVVAIIISVILHVVLAFFSESIRIRFLGDSAGLTTEGKLKLRSESAVSVDVRQTDPAQHLLDVTIPEVDPYDVDLNEIMLATPMDTPNALFEPPASAADLDPGLGAEIKTPTIADDIETVPPWSPREEIFTVTDQIVFSDEISYEQVKIPDVERQMFAPDVTARYEVGAAIRSLSAVGTPSYVNPAPPKVDYSKFAESLVGGDMRMPSSIEAGSIASGMEATAFLREIPSDVAPAEPIESVLKTNVKIYRPRRGDYEYFQVDIDRKGANVLPPLPRDILLVQDASASLAEARLSFCREAMIKIVDEMSPDDRLNVMAFSVDNTLCFKDGWRRADSATKEEAKNFIRSLRSAGSTDFYSAMLAVLELPRDPDRVMLVIVSSDGKPTAGGIQRDSEIIGRFSNLNDGRVSVFGICVSRGSNEFLLSMLSFSNRGGPASIPPDRFNIISSIQGVYDSIHSPVLSDISFLFDSTSKAEVAPAMTTHLYLDRPLRLHGRVEKGTEKVVFQARGVAMGKNYDMVFTLDLVNAEISDKSLAERWATARMYDLVSEYARTPDSRLLDKMNSLGHEYGITIPFRKRLF